MKTQEEIERLAKQIFAYHGEPDENELSGMRVISQRQGFIIGFNAAQENEGWINCVVALPYVNEQVVIITDTGSKVVARFEKTIIVSATSYIYKFYNTIGNFNGVYWMRLPNDPA